MIFLAVALVFGAVGAAIASGKGRNPVVWFLICALVPLVGIILVACLPSEKGDIQGQAVIAPSADFEERWDNMAKFDPDVRAALTRLQPLGDLAIDAFRVVFADVRDKTAISSIVQEIENASVEERLKMVGLTHVETSSGIHIFKNKKNEFVVGHMTVKSLEVARGVAARVPR